MKPYEKPKLIALSLSGNGVMCTSGCSIDAWGDNMDASLGIVLQRSGLMSGGKPIEAVFGGTECQIEISGYCKFVPDGRNIVFNS